MLLLNRHFISTMLCQIVRLFQQIFNLSIWVKIRKPWNLIDRNDEHRANVITQSRKFALSFFNRYDEFYIYESEPHSKHDIIIPCVGEVATDNLSQNNNSKHLLRVLHDNQNSVKKCQKDIERTANGMYSAQEIISREYMTLWNLAT